MERGRRMGGRGRERGGRGSEREGEGGMQQSVSVSNVESKQAWTVKPSN